MKQGTQVRPSKGWPILVVPLLIITLGFGVRHFDIFSEYREYAAGNSIPDVLVQSGRTGRQLRLLDYAPLDGVRVAELDNTLSPEEMPSTVILEAETLSSGLPTLSVVIDPDHLLNRDSGLLANYQKKGRGWERPAYASYFRDGVLVWATGAGLRVHGGSSRAMQHKSFRIHFRKVYGRPALPRNLVFESSSSTMKSLVVHNDYRPRWREGGTEWHRANQKAHYLNPMAYEIVQTVGGITLSTQPVQFYLNGVYQGPYVLKEHLADDFLVARFGHEEFFFADTRADDGASRASLLDKGSQRELREVFTWPRGVPKPLTMAKAAEKVDLENLTNWWISNLYVANTDPYQGSIARDMTKPDGRWFWINWDMDHAFMDWFAQGSRPWEVDNFTGVRGLINSRDVRAVTFNRLRTESPEYRVYFLSRLAEALNHELTPEFMDNLVSRYEDIAIAFGIEDRAYLRSIREYAEHRPAVLREQMHTYFSSGPSYKLMVRAPDSLGIRVDRRAIGEQYTGWYFADTPARIELGDHVTAEHITWIIDGTPIEPGPQPVEINLSADTIVEVRTTD